MEEGEGGRDPDWQRVKETGVDEVEVDASSDSYVLSTNVPEDIA